MNKYEFKQRLEDVIAKDGKERSLYVDYIKLLEYYAKQLSKEIDSITEPTSKSQKDGTSIGFPDIVIRDKNKIIGCIEVKLS